VERDRQCTYNVTSRRVRVIIFAVEKRKLLNVMSMGLCSCLSYLACKYHFFLPRFICHSWPVCFKHICSHCFTNGTIFGNKYFFEHKRVLLFSAQRLPENLLNLGRIHLDIIINVHKCSCKVPVIVVKSNETNFLDRY